MGGVVQKNANYGTVSDLAATQNTLVNTTGTAATPSAGTRTLATISDTATAANAIAGLAAELNLVKADIAALLARVNGTG